MIKLIRKGPLHFWKCLIFILFLFFCHFMSLKPGNDKILKSRECGRISQQFWIFFHMRFWSAKFLWQQKSRRPEVATLAKVGRVVSFHYLLRTFILIISFFILPNSKHLLHFSCRFIVHNQTQQHCIQDFWFFSSQWASVK